MNEIIIVPGGRELDHSCNAFGAQAANSLCFREGRERKQKWSLCFHNILQVSID
jgi:hypothetical protein